VLLHFLVVPVLPKLFHFLTVEAKSWGKMLNYIVVCYYSKKKNVNVVNFRLGTK